jgi:hypothetical protein
MEQRDIVTSFSKSLLGSYCKFLLGSVEGRAFCSLDTLTSRSSTWSFGISSPCPCKKGRDAVGGLGNEGQW